MLKGGGIFFLNQNKQNENIHTLLEKSFKTEMRNKRFAALNSIQRGKNLISRSTIDLDLLLICN